MTNKCGRCKNLTREDLCNLLGDYRVFVSTVRSKFLGEGFKDITLENLISEWLDVLDEATEGWSK